MSPRERPIIFSAEMVKAILGSRKTQTRRVCKLANPRSRDAVKHCPYGRVGDRLWLREAWAAQHRFDARKPSEIPAGSKVHYRATWEGPSGLLWRTPIYVPRWASRVTLEITDIRVQRLVDITEQDAATEGFPLPNPQPGVLRVKALDGTVTTSRVQTWEFTARGSFFHTWASLNGKRAPWSSDPFVWVISFKRVCLCETEIADPGPTHLPECRFNEPRHAEPPF